jgi:hypothetical protein
MCGSIPHSRGRIAVSWAECVSEIEEHAFDNQALDPLRLNLALPPPFIDHRASCAESFSPIATHGASSMPSTRAQGSNCR